MNAHPQLSKTSTAIRVGFQTADRADATRTGYGSGLQDLRARLRGISMRRACADDRERIVKAFSALSPESIYQRFFVFKKRLSDEELRRLTENDGVRDVVLVATVIGIHQEIIVGLGRYVRNGASAEVAFTVDEDYRGLGIASELLRRLTDIARRSGVRRFEADVLPDNNSMLNVFQRSGLPMSAFETDGIVHLTLLIDHLVGVPEGH